MAVVAKSWRPAAAALMAAAAVFACLAPRSAAAEMAPSPSPGSGASADPSHHHDMDEKADVRFRLVYQVETDDLTESERVEFQKYMDQLEVSFGAGLRFEKTVWDLSPGELGFKLGVVFAQAALDCTVRTRAGGSSTRPSPKIPFFVTERLRLSGVMITPRP